MLRSCGPGGHQFERPSNKAACRFDLSQTSRPAPLGRIRRDNNTTAPLTETLDRSAYELRSAAFPARTGHAQQRLLSPGRPQRLDLPKMEPMQAAKDNTMKVGFIGLGRMGAGTAANLLKAGHRLAVYNRTPAKADALTAKGAGFAASVADACRGDAVITMLANDQAVEDVVLRPDGVCANLASGALHISSSTISVALVQQLSDEHAKRGQQFLAAPVFGRPEAAAAAKLFVVAGGDHAAVRTAAPLLEAVGQNTSIVIADTPRPPASSSSAVIFLALR